MTSINTTTWVPLTSLGQLRRVGTKLRRRVIGSSREWAEGVLASTTPDSDGDYHVDGDTFGYVFRSDFNTPSPYHEYQIEDSTEQWEPLTDARQARPGDRVRQIVEDVVVEHSPTGGLRVESGEYFTSYSIGGHRKGCTYEVLTAPRPEPLNPAVNKKHRLVKADGHTWYYSYFGEPRGRYINLAYQADVALTPAEFESRYPDREILDFDY